MNWGLIIAFGCGMLCMWALSNPRKAARTIRGFLGRVGTGAEKLNDRYEERRESREARRPRMQERRPVSRRDDRDRRDDYDYDEQPRRRRPRIVTCPQCEGTGEIKVKSIDFSGQGRRTCPKCQGTGEVPEYD